jgi:hypothetical protein
MPPLTPYRSLTAERRLALVTHALKQSKDVRAAYVQRLVSRGGGFRAVTLMGWPIDKLAREFVRLNAQNSGDEFELLQLLYVELEPGIQVTFLDAAGVSHEAGKMPDDLPPPFADAEAVKRAVAVVRERHGADGEHYLLTVATYTADGWPGLSELLAEPGR